MQKPGVPLWFGGAAEPSLRRTAEIADGWLASAPATAAAFQEGITKLHGFAEEKGRDPSTLDFGKLQYVSVDREPEQAKRLAHAHWPEYSGPDYNVDRNVMSGTPEEVAARLRGFAEADAREVTLILEPSTLGGAQLGLLKEATQGLV